MLANLETSAVAAGLEKLFSLQSQRKAISENVQLPHTCTHLTFYQSNFSKKVSTVHELWNPICSSWIWERQRNQRSNCHHPLDHRKSKKIPEINLLLLYWLCKGLWRCGSQQTGKLTEIGISDHLACLLRNLYASQDRTVRTEHGTADWFQTRKGVSKGCILLPCLLKLYAQYIMQNA